ncbi:AAA family ATPase [Streptomyces lancefieldiae]|uniref:AAA family ATPase n=1 Tax=Streptomyces lancefieldiae TaxID=3075520 RepID=A0ABU3AFM0_9ACTN|nr:AAA family ATPase [Streptomyces sp. DSM 40712]MDT0608789.1 AAA family ATPase [Streptomyces sp. DSM 40712]
MSQLPPPVRTGRQQPQADEYDDGPVVFRPASKDGQKARLSIQGPSGCGKTWTGLSIAGGLAEGERFAVVDTERNAATLYVNDLPVEFDHFPMRRYNPRGLIKALAAAAQAGYPVVMIDSLTHFWKGAEGTLDQVSQVADSKYSGNKFAAWKDGGEIQDDMIEALMSYPGHIVATMRASEKWVLEKGSKTPVSKGLLAEQRKGIEFEFGVAAEMDEANRLRFIKSRCPSFRGLVLNQPNGASDIAKPYLDWLRDGGKEIDATAWIDAASDDTATADSLLALYREVEAASALATPLMHPQTGQPTSLGAYIKERGIALKNAQQ